MSEHEENENDEKKVKNLGVVQHVHSVLKKENDDSEKNEGETEEQLREELAQTKEKLDKRDEELGAIAMQKFEEESREVKKQYKKQFGKKAPEMANPEQLEFVKSMLQEDIDSEMGSLADTGGQIPLKIPSRAQTFEQGRDVIKTLYDAYEMELMKKETHDESFDAQKFADLDTKIKRIWSSIKKGFDKRGGRTLGLNPPQTWALCRNCRKITFERVCTNCGKETMSRAEWLHRSH